MAFLKPVGDENGINTEQPDRSDEKERRDNNDDRCTWQPTA